MSNQMAQILVELTHLIDHLVDLVLQGYWIEEYIQEY